MNLYDVSVAKRMVNVKQTTAVFFVYNMKVSHHDNQEITIVIEWLKQKYEE